MSTSLTAADLRRVEDLLTPIDAHLHRSYPGETGTRQPVHTVYVPGDRYTAGVAPSWAEQAMETTERAGGLSAVIGAAAVPTQIREAVEAQVRDKLAREPIEDLRIDFEDGYGDRGDTEDDDVVTAARELGRDQAAGTAPPYVGIRFKSLEGPTRTRGLRTLDLFITALAENGELPSGLMLTLPKVMAPEQVAAMAQVCDRLEQIHRLPARRLRFEIQVETPQAILGADGRATVARMIHAGEGRVSGLHFGTYDYSPALGVAAASQRLEHPVADYAHAGMPAAAYDTVVRLSDGSTNVMPVGGAEDVHAAWSLHARLVRRSLERGYYQGWDMHPAQLPSRFAATYAFYRADFPVSAERLRTYLTGAKGAVLDEPATARALAGFLQRGLDCGAISTTELTDRAGLSPTELEQVHRGHMCRKDGP